jgi:hypothetical protein
MRNSALMLIAFNPATREAGYVDVIPPTRFERISHFDRRDNLYQLPELSGDPHDWQLLVFIGRADGQMILYGTTHPTAPN